MTPMLLVDCVSPEDLEEVRATLADVHWTKQEDDGHRRNVEMTKNPPLHWLHHKLRHMVAAPLGFEPDDIMPSYIYVLRYQPDSELRWHKDREQCEWTLSLTVDDGGVEWGLTIKPQETPDESVLVDAPVGCGVLYNRLDAHSRAPRPAEAPPFLCVMFHFVSSDFRGGIQ